MTEKTTNFPKSMAKFMAWIIGILLLANFGLGLLSSSIENLFNKLDVFGWGENWRDSVSTDNGMKGKTNGGLTIKEIEKFESEAENRPYYEDIFKNSIVVESDGYVTIYRQIEDSNNIFNLNFVKTDKGLMYDGAVGVLTTGIKSNWLTGKRDFTNVKTTLSTDFTAFTQANRSLWNSIVGAFRFSFNNPVENVVTFSDFKTNFAPGFDNTNVVTDLFSKNTRNAKKDLFNYISNYLVENVMYPHFQNISDGKQDINIELINGFENIDNPRIIKQKLNNFANHLWQNSRSVDGSDKTSIIDMSDYFGSFIPENQQHNYPITGSDIIKFSGFDYYPMYENNVLFETVYLRVDNGPKRDINTINKDADIIEDKKMLDKVEKQETQYSKLQIKLNNKIGSNLTGIDLKENPVVVTVGNRKLLFDDINKLNRGYEIAVESNKNYFWNIESNLLMFDSYSGSLSVGDSNVSKTFDFEYNQGFVNISVSIRAASNADLDKINLDKNPVKIIFTGKNGEGSYQFIFDNNSKLNSPLNKQMKVGEYNYTILSEQLIFATTSGVANINSSERSQDFHYAVTFEEDNSLNIVAKTYAASGANSGQSQRHGDIYFVSDATTYPIGKIKEYFNAIESTKITATLRIYDEFDYLLLTDELDVKGSGGGKFIEVNNRLQNNASYKIQITISSPISSKLLITEPISFNYTANQINYITYGL